MSLLVDMKNFISTGLRYEGAYLIRGEPGTGKTTFCLTAASEWEKEKKKVIFSTKHAKDEIEEKIKNYGEMKNVKVITINPLETRNLTMISHKIADEMEKMSKGDLIIIDSLSSFLLSNEAKQVAKFIQTQVARVRAKEITMLMTVEEGVNEKQVIDLVSYFTDAIFELKVEENKRLFRVYMCKFDSNKLTWNQYKVTNKGFKFLNN